MRRPLAALPLLTLALHAQSPRRIRPLVETARTSGLPVTRVALYKNGVGFFEHSGRVLGNQAVSIDFTTAQLNDVLQTLTAVDLSGGRITGAGYNSTIPLDEQLKSLPLGLGEDPTDVAFFTAIRGARVAVRGPGLDLSGRILSFDLRDGRAGKDDGANQPAQAQRRFLTVVADSGDVRTFEFTSAVSVRLLDTSLHTDVTRYLELLSNNRNQGLRHLTLQDNGTGPRDLHVSYLSEVPVWKSTYRILFTDSKAASQTATLQGWSVVDNTTGSDWVNVHLSLVAGAPQSFIQPLSTPYYTRRPEIPLPAEAQLSPQTHDSGDLQTDDALRAPTKIPARQSSASDSLNISSESAMIDQQSFASPQSRSRTGMSGGVVGGVLGGTVAGTGTGPVVGVRPPPAPYEQLANQSFQSQSTTSAFDDYFEYALTDPITIRKNESALVPTVQTSLPIERVTLWSPREPVALRALWLTNSSALTLDRGSFSIVESGKFGGEGLLEPIHPGERRLLSYAADQAVRVTLSHNSYESHVTHLKIAKGVLTETSSDTIGETYDVRNAAPEPRTVIVEHPVRTGYTLDATAKPDETTPTINRFRVAVAPGSTEHLTVSERHVNAQFIRLVDRTEDQLVLLLRNAKAGPDVLARLQPVFDLHHTVVDLDARIAQRTSEINSIATDQSRLRENLKALKGTPEEKALATRYTGELNAQEDRLTILRMEITELQVQRIAADKEFQERLEAINLDEAL